MCHNYDFLIKKLNNAKIEQNNLFNFFFTKDNKTDNSPFLVGECICLNPI